MTVCDALPNIDFVMSMFLPVDVDPMVSDRYQMEACSTHHQANRLRHQRVLGHGRCGGNGRNRRRWSRGLAPAPQHAYYINVTTGLRHNEEALQKLLFLAEKGLPAMYIPVVHGRRHRPITQPGSVAIVYAGVLAGLVLSQLEREGAPFIVPGRGGAALDMRTMVSPYCMPNWGSASRSDGHYYGMPIFGLAGCSDFKVVDQQAAAEAALTLMGETLGGPNIIHDLGYLESGPVGFAGPTGHLR